MPKKNRWTDVSGRKLAEELLADRSSGFTCPLFHVGFVGICWVLKEEDGELMESLYCFCMFLLVDFYH